MLVTIDKRGSISLPASLRKDMGIGPGSHLELAIEPGGAITLYPVEIYRTIKLSDEGLSKLQAARESEKSAFPEWFEQEMGYARADTE
ncbi:MAG: AbrB/MazE/SpoVT family DNA-binding domain-containing protein [Desulfonatronovibrio sp.]